MSRWVSLIAIVLASQWLVLGARADDDGPVVGVIQWKPALEPDATDLDKTDYWASIALSPSTGKYACSCEWTNQDNATRQAREKCNATDAKPVILCCNGWCALALGKKEEGKDVGYGVGWAADQQTAEKNALDGAKKQEIADAKVVFSINAREMRSGGAIAYSTSTGQWGYSTGGGRSAPYKALQNCKADDAKVIVQHADCWLALAQGDDKTVYGFGFAGNRADAESNAVKDCSKRTTNARIAANFSTNGVAH